VTEAIVLETSEPDVIVVTDCDRPSLNGVYRRAGEAEPIPEAEYIEGLKTILPQREEG
jgi:hypothetical protein